MRRDDNEIIEVFDVDVDHFGESYGAGVGGDGDRGSAGNDGTGFDDISVSRRPRWVVPAGLTAIAAVIAMSIGSGSSDTDSTRSAATTQPAATTPVTLAPLPTTTDPATGTGDPARYVVDLPEGVTVMGANEFDIRENGAPTQLWATPGATATTGKWFEISVTGAFGSRLEATAEAYRTAVGDTPALVEPGLTAERATRLGFVRDSSWVSMTAFGVSVEFLTAVAGSLSVTDSGEPQIDSSLVLFDEFRLIDDRPSGSWLFGEGRAAGLYASFGIGDDYRPDGTNFVNVTVGRPKPADGSYATRVPFIVDPIRAFQAVDGSLGVAGPIVNTGIPFDRPVSLAHWIDADGWLVAIVMDGSVDEVIDVAATARVDADEWDRLATADRGVPDFVDATPGTTYVTDAADDATDEARLVERRTAALTYSWRTLAIGSSPSEGFEVESRSFSPDVPTISTTATNDNQFVFATVPRSQEGAVLTVQFSEDPTLTFSMPLTDRDPTFAVLSAVFSTTAVGAFTATITAADGTVLAAWPTL